MNWKNITVENGFVRQDLTLNGNEIVNYIPLNKVDSFGISSTENQRWLYAGLFFGSFALMFALAGQLQAMMFAGLLAAGLIAIYFVTRQTWFIITSNQTKFTVQVRTSSEELQAVNAFVAGIKDRIINQSTLSVSKAA